MREETREALIKATTSLANSDAMEKAAKKSKEKYREQFMKLVTEAILEERPMRTQVEALEIAPAQSIEEQVEKFRLKEYPEWKVVGIGSVVAAKRPWVPVTLQEDPDLMKFTFVNPETLQVFGRTTEERGAYFDAEALYNEISRLYRDGDPVEEVDDDTLNLWESLLDSIEVKTITTYTLDETYAQLLMSIRPDAVPVYQKYAHPGKMSTKLTPIRKAKEEEVE